MRIFIELAVLAAVVVFVAKCVDAFLRGADSCGDEQEAE